MASPLEILMVEDSEQDARLIEEELRLAGYELTFEKVDTAEDMRAALEGHGWNIILCDYALPCFGAPEALDLLKETGLDIPFIVVSGKIGETAAAEIMKAGAHDYLMKDNLARLVPAIKRELKEAEARRWRRRAEEEIADLAKFPSENPDPVLRIAEDGTVIFTNEAGNPLLEAWARSTGQALPRQWRELVAEVLAAKRRKDVEFECGQRTFTMTFAPVAQAGYVNLYAHDITEHKRLEEQFRQAQKLEAIGRLAGGVAHDFRNQLTVIRGYCDLILSSLDPEDPLRGRLEKIGQAVARSARLSDQFLAFARKQTLQPGVINLNSLIEEMLDPLRHMIGEDVELSFIAGGDLDNCETDADHLRQAVMNLVVNARDAMPNGGRLKIETANVKLGAAYTRRHPGASPGQHVMLAVNDTGIGMDRKILDKIFEPFFTTKEAHKGTGLGLSMVYGFIRQSGGSVDVSSKPGKGSTFTLYLPRANAPVVLKPRPTSKGPRRGTETILVVEDEEAVRDVIVESLRRSGYHVLVAAWPQEALVMGRNFEGQIDLLVTDVVMPKMSGPELAKPLKRLRPDMQILYLSGYAENHLAHHGIVDAGVNLLTKPFSPDSLVQAVGDLLAGASPAEKRPLHTR